MTHRKNCRELPELHIDFVIDKDFQQSPDKYRKRFPTGGYRVVFRCSCGAVSKHLSGVFRSYALADRRFRELALVDSFAPYPVAAEPRMMQSQRKPPRRTDSL